jgi:seryl-tRNA synthetase
MMCGESQTPGNIACKNCSGVIKCDLRLEMHMLDIKYIRENPDKVRQNALNKGVEVDIDRLLELDAERRGFIQASETLKHQHKRANEELIKLKKVGEDASPMTKQLREISDQTKNLDRQRSEVDAKIDEIMLQIPNIAMEDVPVEGEEANKLLREEGEERKYSFEPKTHWDMGESLGILDTKLAAKLAGSNFALFRGAGAKLVRALMQFMLDTHSASGYVEIWPPVLANREVMTGTGQLPKFEEDMYRVGIEKDDPKKSDLFLIPTAEVPLTAMHGGEILQFTDLPLKYCAYTPCFRREAGAYGRETRGLLRVHQFDKVEILKVTTEEQTADELEGLLADAEGIIRKLGLRYRVMLLSTREMTFASERTYDIEIWSPGVQRWLEVSSVSSFGAFQARRLSLRYRDKDRKVRFCHTMNGSGVAFARLIACLLETYQREDGSVEMPEALRPYFGANGIEKT